MTNLDEKILEELDYRTFVNIISNIPSCIFYKDKDLKYRFSSHCWMQLISEDIVGKTDLEIRKDTDNAMKAMEADREILRTKKGCSYVIKSEIDGIVSYLELIKEPILDDNGEAIGIVGLINDVTEKTIMAQEIDKMKKLLEVQCDELASSNEELKTSINKVEQLLRNHKLFTASMNHELRSPLNGIIGLLQLLINDSSLNPSQHDKVYNIFQSSQLMLSLVNELLDYAKMETDEFKILHEEFNLNELLDNIRCVSDTQARSKNLDFEIIVEDNVAPTYIGDKKRLMQIMHNFISNGIKYSDEGTVSLTIAYNNNKLYMSCKDNGQGMSKETKELLFNPFKRFNEKKNEHIQGTGLGLSVVKRIVDKMNGEIIVESELGKGTTFTAIVPIEQTSKHSSTNTTPSISTDTISYENYSALYVDDTDVNLIVMEGLIENVGMNITTTSSVKEAFSLIEKNKYDIIFLDHQMPEMNGVDFFHKMREENDLNKSTPVVMLTANTSEEDKLFYKNEGIEGYLEKPIIKESLYDVIANLCQK